MSSFFHRRVLVAALLSTLLPLGVSAQSSDAPPPRSETFFLELGLGASQRVHDGYVERLEDFGFETPAFDMFGGFEAMVSAQSLGYMLTPNFGILVRHETLESRELQRNLFSDQVDTFTWTTRAVSVGGRVRQPLLNEWFAVYAQVNLGLGIARSSFHEHDKSQKYERHFGVSAALLAGVDANFFKYGGLYVEGGYNYAPIIENELGDRHNDGGATFQVGLRVRGLKGK